MNLDYDRLRIPFQSDHRENHPPGGMQSNLKVFLQKEYRYDIFDMQLLHAR